VGEFHGWFASGPQAAPERPPPAGPSTRSLATAGGHCLTDGGWIAGDHEGRIAALVGHPRWQEPAGEESPAHRLLTLYARHGSDLFSRIGGDFALALIDPVSHRLLLGIDRMGQFPLYFARTPSGIAFGTSADPVLSRAGIDRRCTAQGLYHYLFFHMLPAPTTLFAGVEKLEAAHHLELAGGTLRVTPYWHPRFTESAVNPIPLVRELHALLRASVGRLADRTTPAAFLSGGLDSSTVAGVLADLGAGEVDTFSIGFDAPGYDEMAYARLASRHFRTRAHEYYVTPEDVVTAVPLIAASYDEPFGNSSALPAYFCARLAAETGIQRLLAGDGGDELFAGNARYRRQGLFEPWHRIPAPLRRHLLEPLAGRLPATLPLTGKVRSYVAQARLPLPDRLQSYNHLHRMSPSEMFTAPFLEQVSQEAPWQLMGRIYHRPEEASTLNRMLFLDWQQTLADNDLRKVSRMCQLAGVDVAYPMLDDALVELSCRLPSRLKLRRGRLRHFYKSAMGGFLPREIIDKRKHGFGLPFGHWMQHHTPLRELACDTLLRFRRRGIMQPVFIDHLITLHREGHTAYYGELIWVVMMLELWLATHPNAAADGG